MALVCPKDAAKYRELLRQLGKVSLLNSVPPQISEALSSLPPTPQRCPSCLAFAALMFAASPTLDVGLLVSPFLCLVLTAGAGGARGRIIQL